LTPQQITLFSVLTKKELAVGIKPYQKNVANKI